MSKELEIGVAMTERTEFTCTVCGAPACFGFDYFSRQGKPGRWYCREHDPQQRVTIGKTEAARERAKIVADKYIPRFPPSPWSSAMATPKTRLQDLVLAHGGYDKVTPQAWAQFDAERAAWQASIRGGDKYVLRTKLKEQQR
jgi:hypothetical protein